MSSFDIGETVIASCEVKDDDGAYKDPSTSMKITITDKFNVVKIDNAVMTKDAIGKYHYDCQTTDYVDGKYIVTYVATDGTRITIQKESFNLE